MRRLGPWLGAAFLFVGAAILGSRRFSRVAVSGHSMEPTLLDGDWLLVDRAARAGPGDIVVTWDPRVRDRLIVKRVREAGTDFQLWLQSDHPAHADESIGPVAPSAVLGVARVVYWPADRAGLIEGLSTMLARRSSHARSRRAPQ